MTRAALTRVRDEGKRLGWRPIVPALEKRIREALETPGRPGERKITARFGVNLGQCSGSAALSAPQESSPRPLAIPGRQQSDPSQGALSLRRCPGAFPRRGSEESGGVPRGMA
jgi:hypothetical protein